MSFTCDYCCQSRKLSAAQDGGVDYRYGVLTLLCAIAAAEGGGGGGVTDLTGINGVAPAVGAGAVNPGTLRVTLGGSPTVGLVAGSAIIGSVGIDQTTPGTTNGVQLKAGTALAGKFGIDQTTPGTTNGVSGVASTTGGFTPGRISGGLSNTVVAIKSSAQGKLQSLELFNPNVTAVFVQIFNVATAGAVTLGTTVPTKSIGIPALGGALPFWGEAGLDFSAGIQIAATTTETGSTGLTTNMTVNYNFK